jgi:biotin synthase
MNRDWMALADEAIASDGISRAGARAALAAPETEAWALLAAAGRVRTRFHGNRVRVHVLQNAKLGGCPEDCGFCAQSSRYETPAGRAPLLDRAAIVEGAREAAAAGAWKFCIVTATRGPSDRDLDVLCDAVREIKATVPVKVCTSLGLLDAPKARRLAEAGVDRFNHNLETSRRLFGEICTTHTFDDRVATLRHAREAGMEACCGCIVGMGETDEDLLDLLWSLKEVGPTSIPVNFLDPRPGTPMADRPRPTPLRCLQVLSVFRLVHPRPDLRVAGGREVNLRSLQAAALVAANSIFTNGYLTTPGNESSEDHRMIRDAGFEIETVLEGHPREAEPREV